ncbi:MAG: hypothetical protein ACXVCE_00485 [Bacteriovorax sp.]
MKKLFIATIFVLSALETIQAACDTDAIIYKHETGMGISFGSGGVKSNYDEGMSVNVPLSINGEAACFRKKSQFSLKAENTKDIDKGKIIIAPMQLDFENVPNPSAKQYLYVEKNEDKTKVKFHTMSFVCTGEIPLSIEATSDSYSKIFKDSQNATISYTTVFATGAAADNLNAGRRALSSQGTFDFFAKLYKEKTQRELDVNLSYGQKTPSIISDTSINAMAGIERDIVSSFTTMGARVPNGCSKDFSTAMEQYLLENYEQNDSLKDYKIKTKWFSDDLVFSWE